MVSTTVLFVALEFTVTVLWKLPIRFVSYFTVMFPSAPGAIGSRVHFGVVQPQEARTEFKTNGSVPSFLNLNTRVPFAPFSILP